MIPKKEAAARREKDKKPKIKKETLRDLDTRDRAGKVKGGVKDPTLGCQR